MGAVPQEEGGDQGWQEQACLPASGGSHEPESSWLVEPFMVSDWEKLRESHARVRVLMAGFQLPLGLGLMGPRSPQAPGQPSAQPRCVPPLDLETHASPQRTPDTSSSVLA